MHRLLLTLLLSMLLFATPRTSAEAEDDSGPGDRRAGRIAVRGDGTYRITAKQLALLGIPSAQHADVRRRGRDVQVWRDAEVAGETGALVFVARATAGPHTRYAVFEVWQRASAAPDEAAPTRTGFEVPREVAPDRVLGELGAADRGVYDHAVPAWFAGMAPRNQSVDVHVGPMGAAAGKPQSLIATVYATWRGPIAMRASWNGHDLGLAQGALGVAGAHLRWEVPANQVPKAPATLTLKNLSPPPARAPARDVSRHRGTLYIDVVRLEGPGQRIHAWGAAKPVVVTKAGPVRDPLRAAGKATHVIVAVPAVVAAAKRLATHRTKRGVASVVIPVTDVYDRYGHGEHRPEAIRAFVADLQRREGAPLRYVVLAGDATFDRTDREQAPTIPAWFTRSKYNGATASDARYVPVLAGQAPTAIGRLPFRKAEEMRAYVDRVIRYETNPPTHASRRMMRFITSEGRFSPFIDKIIENKFRNVLADNVPAAYDVEVTYANPRSPFLWPPPELSSKVIAGLNEGALFYTYVGHGFEKGFDTLRAAGKRYGILHVRDVPQVDVKHTSPIVFVLACTTAMFDGVHGDGVGEALMKRPNGPVAYWGASRVCHPVYNAFIGEAIATNLARRKQDRLGTILATSRADAVKLPDKMSPVVLTGLKLLSGVSDLDRLFVEGDAMYTLLGDPALEIAFPRDSITVQARTDVATRTVAATLSADLPDGTQVHVALEAPRNKDLVVPEPVANPADPASFPTIRRNHALVNERVLERATVTLKDGKAEVRFTLKEGLEAPGLIVKAWCIAKGDVHQGATALK